MAENMDYLKFTKKYDNLPPFRPIIDTTGTPHYNLGKFIYKLLNSLSQNEYSLYNSFRVVSDIQNTPQELFSGGYINHSLSVAVSSDVNSFLMMSL